MKSKKLNVAGFCHQNFNDLKLSFEENFLKHGELGSAICVYHDGKPVVDLWGGFLDANRTKPWNKNTLCLMYSLAKSICALSIHILADRQKLNLEKPVCDYWPEFALFNKQNIKVRHCISHWCGVWSNENAKPGDIYDPKAMQRAIEEQRPEWEVEQKGAYNTINIGFICGAIVKNVTGKTIQKFIYEEIVKPLNVNYYLGVPEEKLALCAEIIPNPADSIHSAGKDPDSPVRRAWRAFPKNFGPTEQNSLRFKKAGVPSFGGFGDARSMAKIYALIANGGEIDGIRLLSASSVKKALKLQWSDLEDGLLKRPTSMAMGFMKNPPDGTPLFTEFADAFGHLGSGGARAFAVPSKNIAGTFISNFQSERRSEGVRTENFINAVNTCIHQL